MWTPRVGRVGDHRARSPSRAEGLEAETAKPPTVRWATRATPSVPAPHPPTGAPPSPLLPPSSLAAQLDPPAGRARPCRHEPARVAWLDDERRSARHGPYDGVSEDRHGLARGRRCRSPRPPKAGRTRRTLRSAAQARRTTPAPWKTPGARPTPAKAASALQPSAVLSVTDDVEQDGARRGPQPRHRLHDVIDALVPLQPGARRETVKQSEGRRQPGWAWASGKGQSAGQAARPQLDPGLCAGLAEGRRRVGADGEDPLARGQAPPLQRRQPGWASMP